MNSQNRINYLYAYLITFWLCILFISSCTKLEEKKSNTNFKVECLEKNKRVSASDSIKIKYKTSLKKEGFKLVVSNSLNSSLVFPILYQDLMIFNIPKTFCEKAGRLEYVLFFKKRQIDNGVVVIKPNRLTKTIETYLGPNYISTLENEYGMLVSIPFDKYDNINKNRLKVAKTIRGNKSVFNPKSLKYVNYNRIFSIQKTGKIYLQVFDKDTVVSKKKEIVVRASYAEDFRITHSRNNDLADGKEITEIKTSVITDAYGNSIENGSLVTFVFKEEKQTYYGYAKTINGIANFKKVHPALSKEVIIQAFVEGFSKSNSIRLSYKNDE